jgi:hypothetical protein
LAKQSKSEPSGDTMARLLVGVSVNLDPELLAKINTNIKAKSQSERIRLCVEQGYEYLKR